MQQITSIVSKNSIKSNQYFTNDIFSGKNNDAILYSEYDEFEKILTKLNQKRLDVPSLINYYICKLEEVNFQLKLLKSLTKKEKANNIHFLPIEEYKSLKALKDILIDKIKSLVTFSTDVEDRKRNETMNIDSFNYQGCEIIKKNNDKDAEDSSKNINLKDKELILNLTIFYCESPINKPQHLKLKTNSKISIDAFYRLFKKELGIYEFAQFRIVILKGGEDLMFLNNINELKSKKENFIKIVPLEYKINC